MGPISGQSAFSYQLLPSLPGPILASLRGLGTREKLRTFSWFRGCKLVTPRSFQCPCAILFLVNIKRY